MRQRSAFIALFASAALAFAGCITERETPPTARANNQDVDLGGRADMRSMDQGGGGDLGAVDMGMDLSEPDMPAPDMGACGDGSEVRPCQNQVGACLGAEARCAAPTSDAAIACDANVYAAHSDKYAADDAEAWRCDGIDNDCDGQIDEACCTQAPYKTQHQWPLSTLVGGLTYVPEQDHYIAIISQYVKDAQGDYVAELKSYVLNTQGKPTAPAAQLAPASSPEGNVQSLRVGDELWVFFSRDDGGNDGRYLVKLSLDGSIKQAAKRYDDASSGRTFVAYHSGTDQLALVREHSLNNSSQNDWRFTLTTSAAFDVCVNAPASCQLPAPASIPGLPDELEPAIGFNESGHWMLAWPEKQDKLLAWVTAATPPTPASIFDSSSRTTASANIDPQPLSRSLRTQRLAITAAQDTFTIWYPNHNAVGASITALTPGMPAKTITQALPDGLLVDLSVVSTPNNAQLVSYVGSVAGGQARRFLARVGQGQVNAFELNNKAYPYTALATAPQGMLALTSEVTDMGDIQATSMLLSHEGVPICQP